MSDAVTPIKSPSREFAEAWCAERGIAYDSTHFGDVPFGRAFRFYNYSYEGDPLPDKVITRHDRAEAKYMQGTGTGTIIYSPAPDAQQRFEAADEVWIAEGEGKTLALYQLGLPVLGVRGCAAWHRPGDTALHPALAKLLAPGKRVNIVFDADWQTNINVHKGLYGCMAAVRTLGGHAAAVMVPPVPGVAETGVDDLIAIWRANGMNTEQVRLQIDRLERREEIPNPFLVDFKNPLLTAANVIEATYGDESFVHWQGDFYRWQQTHWQLLRDELLRETIYKFAQGVGMPAKSFQVNQIVDAARAFAQIEMPAVPCWLQDAADLPDPNDLLACANGLLNLQTGELLPHSPDYFNLSASAVRYDPTAECLNWLRFIDEIYPADPTAAATLQEFIGYTLTTDTAQQKALLLVGAKRSGKGTVVRVVQALLGRDAYCAPTMASMSQNFGFQPWIGKRAAFVSDARVSSRNNAQAMVEKVLTITGEDTQQIDRKFRPQWEGRLHTRLWILSNQLPAMLDTGAALVSRFLLLRHPVTFYGREDTGLTDKLTAELPGILNWALVGLARLRQRGHFVQPDSGVAEIEQWERMNSPMKAFVEDACKLDPDASVPKTALRIAFNTWADANDVSYRPSAEAFSNDISSATDNRVTTGQQRVEGGRRVRVFKGVRLAQVAQGKY